MSKLSLSVLVNAPIERTFDYFTNFKEAENMVDAIEKVEMLTDGPVGTGTRFRETRIIFGKEATEEMEVTAFETGRLCTISAESCGTHFESTFLFMEQNGGTQVNLEMVTQARSIGARLMWPLGLIMMPKMKKMMLADMQQVKAACESA